MIFNSFAFAIFLPIVFILYWFVTNKNLKSQNIFLLVASYFFYGWWDWRFLLLLVFLSLSNYFIGLKIGTSEDDHVRRGWLRLGLLINIGVLCLFKYFNFFIDSFIDIISLTGYELPRTTTRIILPLGISFYTFLSLSYIIDIFKNNTEANKDIFQVILALSFFPIILAGPIQRPTSLLPHIAHKRSFEYPMVIDGLRQILWGLFAKVVIADNLASRVDAFFQDSSGYSGSTLFIGIILYAVQIYADFSGYSNIAIGTGKLFGFSLMQNFNYPYFSRDIAEFWKRWHISLTTWFRDYVFLSLSFAISWKISKERIFYMKTDIFIYIMASMVTWFLTGLWHGANYTFIVWGMIHGIFLILHHIQRKPRKKLLSNYGIDNNHTFIVILERCLTLFIVLMAWVFFRADSTMNALNYISHVFTSSLFTIPTLNGTTKKMLGLIVIFLFIEWMGREHQHALCCIESTKSNLIRWACYYTIIFFIIFFGGQEQEFIYLQF